MGTTALIVALVLLLPAIWVARKATLRRLAWRNVTSRPTEAILVTVGTMLGTAIIVASFVVGDTIEDGIGSVVDTSLGPIDQSVTIEDPAQLQDLEDTLAGADIANVDGFVSVLSLPTAVTTTGEQQVGEPRVWIAEIDFDSARKFGGDPATSGFAEAGATPSGNEAVLTSTVAADLGVTAGDEIEVHVLGSSLTFTVRELIERYSAAGWNSIYVPEGTIEQMMAAAPAGSSEPRAEVLVSNVGGFEDGAELTASVVAALEEATSGMEGLEIEKIKQNALDDASDEGAQFTTLFNGIGSFAVIAGVLLIVNLFVMLAEERKTSLGIMRAVGFSRGQVTRSFAIEGAVYSVVASVVGVAVGLGVGYLLVQVLKLIFFEDVADLTIGFAPQAESLMLAVAIGLGITMITIWLTATRIARFNVIAAIRDLPQPPTRRGRVRNVIFGIIGLAGGAALTYLGLVEESAAIAMVGVPIAAFSTIPLTRPLLGERIASVVGGTIAMAWGILVFSFFPDVMRESDIEVFVVQGVVLVAAAVIILASASRLWSKAVDALAGAGAGLATRLGLVYPLARKGRTGLLLGMFSLVIFTVTFLAVFSGILGEETQGLADDSRAGYDIVANSASFNPVSDDQLGSVDGVGGYASLVQSPARFEVDGQGEPIWWRVTGFDNSLLAYGTPVLGDRVDAFPSDAAVFEAVLADPTLIVVDDFFLDTGSGPGGERFSAGDEVTLVTESGDTTTLTIAGILASDWVFAGSYMSADAVDAHLDPTPGKYYVKAAPGTDPELLAGTLNAELLTFGMDAETFSAGVEAEVAETVAILRLFQGFLSLGLLIGIAGLAVTLVRAVRERRRSIGVLRALGTSERVVRRSFLVESAFVAIQGVLIGAGLGLVTAYQVIVNSNTFGDAEMSFVWPWVGLAMILVIPTAAALLAAAAPARRASMITPAVALRTE